MFFDIVQRPQLGKCIGLFEKLRGLELRQLCRFERSMLMKDFNVGAMCADGYKGNATVTKCTSVNQPYSVSGCLPEKCTEPSPAEKANYNIITYSLERPSFSVTARCKSGKGTGKAIPCTDDKQPYKLEGCSAISGQRPRWRDRGSKLQILKQPATS